MIPSPNNHSDCNLLIEEAEKLVEEMTLHINEDGLVLSFDNIDLSSILYIPETDEEKKNAKKLLSKLEQISALLNSGHHDKLSDESLEKWQKIEAEWRKFQKRKDYEVRFQGHDDALPPKYSELDSLLATFDDSIARLKTIISKVDGVHSTLDKALLNLDTRMKRNASANSVQECFLKLNQTFSEFEAEARLEKACFDYLENKFEELDKLFKETDDNLFQLTRLADNLPEIKRASMDEYRKRVEYHCRQLEEYRKKLEERRQLIASHRQQLGTRQNLKYDLYQRIEAFRQPVDEYSGMLKTRRKRHRTMSCVLLLMLLAGLGVYQYWKTSSHRRYRQRLQAIIDNEEASSEEGSALLAEMEKTAPDSRHSEDILKLEEDLKIKRLNEEARLKAELENAAKFERMKSEFYEKLKDFGNNNDAIKSLLKQLEAQASPKQKKAVETLKKSYEEQRAKYLKSLENEYRRLYQEAERSYSDMNSKMEAHDFDTARQLIREINSHIENADKLTNIPQSVKNEMLPLRKKYSNAADQLEQALFDYNFANLLNELAKPLKTFTECIESQNYAAAKEVREHLRNPCQEKLPQLDDAQAKVNPALGKRYATLRTALSRMDARLNELDILIQREYSELERLLSRKDMGSLRIGLESFLAAYPRFCEKSSVEEMLRGIALDESKDLTAYDTALLSWGNDFDLQYAALKKHLQKHLVDKSVEYRNSPTFLMSFKNKKTNGVIDLYLKSDTDKEGILFERKLLSNDYYIWGRYVLGCDDKLILLKLSSQSLEMTDIPPVKITVAYPPAMKSKKVQLDFSKERYNFMGPCGEWLYSIHKSDTVRFTDTNSWRTLDTAMKQQLLGEIDSVRAALLWQSILNELFSACNKEFGKGGKFEATELVMVKQQLDASLAALPKGYQWFSLGWKYPREAAELSYALKHLTIEEPFFNSFNQLEEKRRNVSKKPTPVAVLYATNVKSNNKKWCLTNIRPFNAENGLLYIVDTTTKTTTPVASFHYVFFNQRWELLNETKMDRCCYLLFTKN